MFVEVRNSELKRASFSAVNLDQNEWIWKDVMFEEPWWISLGAIAANVLLLTVYTDSNSPDKKSVFAFNADDHRILWWKNNFTLTSAIGDRVLGVDTKYGSREICLSTADGKEVSEAGFPDEKQNLLLVKPFQYREGSGHFETVRSFLQAKCQISPVILLEYSEYNSLILISAFTGQVDLANYLFVFNSAGDLIMKEVLGDGLKGIATDTFFIFSGYLIFVKNKRVLVSYKIV